MSTHLRLKLFAGVLLSLVTGLAFATPTYVGDTEADFDSPCTNSGPNSCPSDTPTGPNEAGYWIWNDAAGWHIRWTGGSSTVYTFAGVVSVDSGSLTSGPVQIAWEGGGAHPDGPVLNFAGPVDELFWYTSAFATTGWDGIDFGLTGYQGDIEFDLWSDLWGSAYDADCVSGCEAQGSYIYIGDGNPVGTIEVRPTQYANLGGRTQSFEVQVPEPGTLALLGLGLAGLGFRRKALS